MAGNIKTILAILLILPAGANAALAQKPKAKDIPIELLADEVRYDRELGVIAARGNVEVSHEGRVLLADTISYNQNTDILTASGNISLLEPTDEVIFAQYLELSGDMKAGIIRDLRIILSDKSRLAATNARRLDGNILELDRAVYSPCNLCRKNPKKPPLWQIKAIKITHNKRRKTIEYKDAWLEIAGVPVFYTPYLSHPDPTVKRQSGFLAPSIGNSSDLGLIVKTPYFYNIAPNRDATITPIYTTEEGAILAGEYRQLFKKGELKASGSITRDSNDNWRGHLFSKGRFNLDDTWRTGFDINRATDDTYLRRYNFESRDTLETKLFFEGFRKRNYFSAEALAFQGLEESDDPGNTPYVLPMINYNHVGESGRFGGRTSFDANLLALTRTDGTDVRRLSLKSGWQLPYVGPMGDQYTLSASLRGDVYQVNGLKLGENDDSFNGITGRIRPELALRWRYPFVRRDGKINQIFEPIVSAIVTPYGGNPAKIPNEDSQEFEFDDTNLFSNTRFTGLDRVESGPRVNYGLKWGVFGEKGGRTTVIVGQSYRVRTDDTFADGSGLEDNFSDIVGMVRVAPNDQVNVLYRTRLNKDNFGASRNEIQLKAGPKALRLDASYLFFDRQENSEFPGREELTLGVYSQFNRYWRASSNGIRDLKSDEMRNLSFNLTYEDECLVFSSQYTRTFFEDRDIRPSDTFMFRIILKTLGEFETGL